MKNKILALIMSSMLLVSCSSNNKNYDNLPYSNNNSIADDLKPYSYYSLNMNIPSTYEKVNLLATHILYDSTSPSASDILYNSDRVYYSILGASYNYSETHSNYDTEDVWDILNEKLRITLGNLYDIHSFKDIDITFMEKTNYIDTEFIKYKGVIAITDTLNNDYDISFIAYCSILDLLSYATQPAHNDVPMMFISFTTSNDSNTINNMETSIGSIIDTLYFTDYLIKSTD